MPSLSTVQCSGTKYVASWSKIHRHALVCSRPSQLCNESSPHVMTGIMMYLYIQKTIVRNAAQPEFLSMSSCSMLCTATAFIKEALSRSVCASVLCIYVCMFMYRCMCMLMCKCMCICMYVCIYIYRYMYMYMYMYIHTMICNCRVSVNAAACDGKPHGHCSSGLMLPEPPILGATAANCFV